MQDYLYCLSVLYVLPCSYNLRCGVPVMLHILHYKFYMHVIMRIMKMIIVTMMVMLTTAVMIVVGGNILLVEYVRGWKCVT